MGAILVLYTAQNRQAELYTNSANHIVNINKYNDSNIDDDDNDDDDCNDDGCDNDDDDDDDDGDDDGDDDDEYSYEYFCDVFLRAIVIFLLSFREYSDNRRSCSSVSTAFWLTL